MWPLMYYCRKSFGLERIGFRLTNSLAHLLWNLPDIYVPAPITSLCSGVWLESVSQWGRNRRASLEAGDAGHPGPTAPGPAGQERRVQRGSATTPSKAWRQHLLSHFCLCWEAVLECHNTILESVWGKLD